MVTRAASAGIVRGCRFRQALSIVFVALLRVAGWAAPGDISTYAGGNGEGSGVSVAQLPSAVAVSGSQVYVSDFQFHPEPDLQWHVVRRLDVLTGIETVVAGIGTPGFGGDGGPATVAHLNEPEGLAVDAAGHLFIADAGNQRIRRLDTATGIITTVAGNGTAGFGGDGGLATAAQLNSPAGLASDGAGNVFIADYQNQRIRRIGAGTGSIGTVAGTGDFGFSGDGGPATRALLYSPVGVGVDGTGDLFVVDSGDNLISVFANARVRRISAATGIITTVAGNGTPSFSGDGGTAAAAQLSNPTAVAVDGNGRLLVADYFNRRVRRVDAATGIITTLAGNGTAGFSGDGGPATAAQLSTPDGLAVDEAGNLFIADTVNQRVRRVNGHSGVITTVAGNGTSGFSGDGGPATAAQLAQAGGVAVDGAGNLFIADRGNSRIRRVDAASGIITTIAGTGTYGYSGDGGPATAAQIKAAGDLAVDAAGNLFIADSGNQRIRRVDAATGIITTVAGNGTAGFSGDGGLATAAQLDAPARVEVNAAGDLFIVDVGNVRIRRVDAATGIITTVAGNGTPGLSGEGGPATAAELDDPDDVAVNAAGDVFIADLANRRIRRVEGSDTTTTTSSTTTTTSLPATCAAAPLPGCRLPIASGKATLRLQDKTPDTGDASKWTWTGGAATTLGDLGDPRTTTAYVLCLYDAAPTLLMTLGAPAGGICGTKPCWKVSGTKGFRYSDKEGTSDGVVKLALEAGGGAGKTKMSLQAKGAAVPLPPLTGLALPLRVQLQANGQCWEASYSTDRAASPELFRATSD
jgi:trimeric autotransporter adhesin